MDDFVAGLIPGAITAIIAAFVILFGRTIRHLWKKTPGQFARP
jgi:hypothetical protein